MSVNSSVNHLILKSLIKDRHLPEAPGRQWHEADINYSSGFRGDCRLVYSNDGLIFVSYDHAKTFYELVR